MPTLFIREAAAVQEWLDSDRHFHVMRDPFDHAELVPAGMWGGVRNALPPVSRLFSEFLAVCRSKGVENRTADQEALRMMLRPIIRRSVLVQASQFDFCDHRDFPADARLPRGCWVGGAGRQLLEILAPTKHPAPAS